MTIDKSRRVFLAFAMLAISSVALTQGPAAIAKPAIQRDAQNHRIHRRPEPRTPAVQSKHPVDDPFADMLLG